MFATTQNRKTFFSEPAAQISGHDGGVDQATFERLAQNGHVADDDHLNVVAPLVHAEVLQPNRRGLPYAAAQALDAEPFATQIFGASDARARNEIEIFTAAQAGDDFHVAPADR